MKRFIAIAAICLLAAACSDEKNNESAKQEEPAAISSVDMDAYVGQVFEFDAANLTMDCKDDNKIICAIDLAAKCTLDPKQKICDGAEVPDFIFMEDENLGRPTKMTYKIEKVKNIGQDTVEIFTKSTCDGNWFGLCQGNVIYVMGTNQEDGWKVKDIYAIAE